MDNIVYPRGLNRPTYLVWRFTWQDITWILAVFIAGVMPSTVTDKVPPEVGFFAALLFVLYKGCVVSLKPRGWDTHVVKSWMTPTEMNPGHCHRRCFIQDKAPPLKTTSRLSRLMRALKLAK